MREAEKRARKRWLTGASESRLRPRSAVANGVAATGGAFPRPPPSPARGAGLPPSLRSTAQAWPRGRLRVGALGTPAGRGSRPREGTQWVERARPWRPEGTDGGPASQWRSGGEGILR